MKHALALAAAATIAFAIPQAHSKSLVIYFSQPEESNVGQGGVDAVSGASALWRDGQAKGSNQYVAELVAKASGADLFRLETVEQYPRQHEALTSFAKGEAEGNARPELKALPDLSSYDTVFIGYPIWWYKMPMALYTMFDRLDFSGKQVAPFTVHGGSRLGGTDDEIRRLEPGAKVLEGLAISRSDVADDDIPEEVGEWVGELGLGGKR